MHLGLRVSDSFGSLSFRVPCGNNKDPVNLTLHPKPQHSPSKLRWPGYYLSDFHSSLLSGSGY